LGGRLVCPTLGPVGVGTLSYRGKKESCLGGDWFVQPEEQLRKDGTLAVLG